MPYLGFFLVLIKRPFSRTTNIVLMVYCAIISSILIHSVSNSFRDRYQLRENTTPAIHTSVAITENTKVSEPSSTSEEHSTVIKGFYRIQIENMVEKRFNEGLKFPASGYLQIDPMECGLWVCTNTFTGKMTKKSHTYSARVGHNELYNDGYPQLFYLAIDGDSLFWDEDGEYAFLEAVGK